MWESPDLPPFRRANDNFQVSIMCKKRYRTQKGVMLIITVVPSQRTWTIRNSPKETDAQLYWELSPMQSLPSSLPRKSEHHDDMQTAMDKEVSWAVVSIITQAVTAENTDHLMPPPTFPRGWSHTHMACLTPEPCLNKNYSATLEVTS